jgi:hypothetical protein
MGSRSVISILLAAAIIILMLLTFTALGILMRENQSLIRQNNTYLKYVACVNSLPEGQRSIDASNRCWEQIGVTEPYTIDRFINGVRQ